MNKIELEDKIINIKKDEEIYLFNKNDNQKIYNISENVTLKVYQYDVDCSSNIEINLNGNNAEVEYHYSTINYNDHNFKIKVNHNCNNTSSNIYNHGVNILSNLLHFDVTGLVPKKKENCVCNQENQIINLQDGNSTILPILLIDNYNVSSSHSAYIGKFKDEIIFYLMSRGISREKAIKLLVSGLLINNGKENENLTKFQQEIENI